ncbi:MAG: hypothetical protein RIK87_00795 [Fuerstiella sp.]
MTVLLYFVAALLTTGLCGCGDGSVSPHPVDAEVARETLHTVLEGWKSGVELDAWREQHADITVQDMDWHFGNKLQAFTILSGARAVDANLRCDVQLIILDPQGNKSQKTVTYLVGTSPRTTVFREMIP